MDESTHLRDDALWRRIRAFPLDDPASPWPFSRRLASENGWSTGFALRVTFQYRRFLFLSMVAGHPVTPSDEVDQAWHLHLIYTRSYWNDLCGQVLGRALHHGPTPGGSEALASYQDQYQRTLDRYAQVFGEPPPGDIWPPVATRFGLDTVRVRRRDAWILRKPWRARR